MLEVLAERGFAYDSSVPYEPTAPELLFPYTLDFGAVEQHWRQRGITAPHAGLWEVPLPALVDGAFAAVTVQDPPGSRVEIVELLKSNFGSDVRSG